MAQGQAPARVQVQARIADNGQTDNNRNHELRAAGNRHRHLPSRARSNLPLRLTVDEKMEQFAALHPRKRGQWTDPVNIPPLPLSTT